MVLRLDSLSTNSNRAVSEHVHGNVMFGFWYFLSCFVCFPQLGPHVGIKRSEDPGDKEEEALEPPVQIADQQFFKMADGE